MIYFMHPDELRNVTLVDFAHAFPRFSVMNNKSRPCIPEFLPNIFRVLEGLAGYPTVMVS